MEKSNQRNGFILNIIGGTGNAESSGTPYRTIRRTRWPHSVYYRWHWECREQWDSIQDEQTYTMATFCILHVVLGMQRAVGLHTGRTDPHDGYILNIIGGTGNAESSGTPYRTNRPTRWPHSVYYRWHWECREQWDSIEDGQTYTMIIFSATFAVPLLSLAFTYTCVGRRLWLRASPGNADPTRDLAQLRAKRKVKLKNHITLCMVLAIVTDGMILSGFCTLNI
jgi:hypothetical protein